MAHRQPIPNKRSAASPALRWAVAALAVAALTATIARPSPVAANDTSESLSTMKHEWPCRVHSEPKDGQPAEGEDDCPPVGSATGYCDANSGDISSVTAEQWDQDTWLEYQATMADWRGIALPETLTRPTADQHRFLPGETLAAGQTLTIANDGIDTLTVTGGDESNLVTIRSEIASIGAAPSFTLGDVAARFTSRLADGSEVSMWSAPRCFSNWSSPSDPWTGYVEATLPYNRDSDAGIVTPITVELWALATELSPAAVIAADTASIVTDDISSGESPSHTFARTEGGAGFAIREDAVNAIFQPLTAELADLMQRINPGGVVVEPPFTPFDRAEFDEFEIDFDEGAIRVETRDADDLRVTIAGHLAMAFHLRMESPRPLITTRRCDFTWESDIELRFLLDQRPDGTSGVDLTLGPAGIGLGAEEPEVDFDPTQRCHLQTHLSGNLNNFAPETKDMVLDTIHTELAQHAVGVSRAVADEIERALDDVAMGGMTADALGIDKFSGRVSEVWETDHGVHYRFHTLAKHADRWFAATSDGPAVVDISAAPGTVADTAFSVSRGAMNQILESKFQSGTFVGSSPLTSVTALRSPYLRASNGTGLYGSPSPTTSDMTLVFPAVDLSILGLPVRADVVLPVDARLVDDTVQLTALVEGAQARATLLTTGADVTSALAPILEGIAETFNESATFAIPRPELVVADTAITLASRPLVVSSPTSTSTVTTWLDSEV